MRSISGFSLILVIVASGCQNQISVKVDAVLGVTSTRLNPESHLGQQLDARIRDLSQLIYRCEDAKRAMDSFLAGFPDSKRPAAEDSLRDRLNDMATILLDARRLREECREYYAVTNIVDVAADVRTTIRRVEIFFESTNEKLTEYAECAKEQMSLASLSASSSALEEAAHEALAAKQVTEPARRPPLGFGGFSATDVYAINPSDPKYQEVLAGKGTRFATLTAASFGATGDSAVMMVMEHPGQIRVYQVSNDPTQVTRNVGLLVSKATQAAAKFAVTP